MNGFKPILLPERRRGHIPGGGLPHAGGHQLHRHMVINELKRILVSRDHHGLPPRLAVHLGDGADQIIGLPAFQLIPGDIHGIQHLPDQRQLGHQVLRHRLPLCLIPLIGQMPKGRRL